MTTTELEEVTLYMSNWLLTTRYILMSLLESAEHEDSK